MEFIRFFAVAVAGLIIDTGLALLLHHQFGLLLTASSAVGFLVAAAINYVLHELWTFKDRQRSLSSRRAVYYLGLLLITLITRVAAVEALLRVFPSDQAALTILIIAAGISFTVNFILSKAFVFKSSPAEETPTMMSKSTKPTISLNDQDWELPSFTEAVYTEQTHRYALVIPVINEGTRIQNQLKKIHELGAPVDVIVADGGSTDGSLVADFLNTVGVSALLTKTSTGKLSAQLRMAYAWCLKRGYEGIITIDGNGKDGVEAIKNMIAMLEDGFDYVQGSRYSAGGMAINTPLERTIGNRLIHAPILSISGRKWLTDTTNGFRAYSREYLLDPRVQPFRHLFSNYELLFYLTARAGQLGFRVCETPVCRSYPKGEKTPTKINGFQGKVAIIKQLVAAALGQFNPPR